jgi:hypothetical protein
MKAILILCFFGFVSFQFLAIYEGEIGKIGFAIGYAILSMAFFIFLFGVLILEKIHRKDSPQEY